MKNGAVFGAAGCFIEKLARRVMSIFLSHRRAYVYFAMLDVRAFSSFFAQSRWC